VNPVRMLVQFLRFYRFRRVGLRWAAVIGRWYLLGHYTGVGSGAHRGSISVPSGGYSGNV
jgi:hypothetical protein